MTTVTLADILALAKQKGLKTRDLAKITGKDYTTVWRWKKNPKADFVFDKGMAKLLRVLNEDK